jgi:TetR/AcrR family transcriptional repressor of nem operon
MGRPREFDRDEALDRAMSVFWARGYERTSVSDLTDSMGIQRGSLYAAFGDKQHLFLEALDRYEERFHGEMVKLLEASSGEGIRRVFERVVSDCACDDGMRGCLITNTAVALSEDEPEISARVRRNLRRIEGAFFDALERDGRIDARALARFFTNALQGLRVLSRCSVDLDVLHEVVEVTLSVLKETAPTPEPTRENKKGDPANG